MFKQHHLALYIVLTCFISTLFAEIGAYGYSILTHSPYTNWADLGLWVESIAHGHLYSPKNLLIQTNSYDYILGLSVHCLVAIIFALMYILYLKYILKTNPTLINGLIFGLILTVFPLFCELPSMGLGIMGINSSGPMLVFCRVIIYHACFGIGLGAGGILTLRCAGK